MNENDDDDSEIDAGSEPIDAEEDEHDWRQIGSAMGYTSDDSSAEQSNEERDVSETQSTSIASSEAG